MKENALSGYSSNKVPRQGCLTPQQQLFTLPHKPLSSRSHTGCQSDKVTQIPGFASTVNSEHRPPEHFGPNAGFESIARCLLLYGDLTLRAPTTEYRASLWATLVLQTTEIQPGTRFRLFLIGCTVQLLCKSMDVIGYMERRELPNCSYQRHLNTISCSDNTPGFVKILGFYSVGKEGPIKFLWSILVY